MTDPVTRFFDDNVVDYAEKHYASGARTFMTVRQSRMLSAINALNLPHGAKALDAGCGPGFLLAALAGRGFEVYGLDAAPEMLRMTLARLLSSAPEKTFVLKLGSIESLPFADESFDLVCTAGVVEYLESDRSALNEIFRVLRPDGYVLYPVTNSLSPINYLDSAVEVAKRRKWLLRFFNFVSEWLGLGPVHARHFRVRRHSPSRIRADLATVGFWLVDACYFYFLPVPRPFDKLFPVLSAFLGESMERLGRSFFGPLGEGYLTVSRKRAPTTNERGLARDWRAKE